MYLDSEADHETTIDKVRRAGREDASGDLTVQPYVMCGGSGTRLWPLSRTCMPKQFVSLVEGDPSTFQSTVLRVAAARGFGRLTIVAPVANRHVVAEQMAAVNAGADVVLEPEGRDSCAAVAVAALHAARTNPNAVVLAMSADHVVDDAVEFVRNCSDAALLARDGHVVVFGTVPNRDATEFGYVLPAETIGAGPAARVARFVEKPDADRAAALASDGALWNAGYFLFRANVMIEEMDRHVPAVMLAVRTAMAEATVERGALFLGTAGFADAPKLSFDRAVMELTDRAVVYPVGFGWLDIGTWGSLWEASRKDGNGNALHGRVHARETRDSIVRSQGGLLTAVLGLDGVVVVATDDAVLVTTRERAGEVKELVGALKAEASPETDDHLRMHRPWGWYQRIDVGARFQVKRIMVKPKGRLSLQKHHHRAEHWIVVRGTAEVTVDGAVTLVHENESVQLPIGCVHRLANPGKISLELVEVQVGSYTGEDDIVRFDDDYGR